MRGYYSPPPAPPPPIRVALWLTNPELAKHIRKRENAEPNDGFKVSREDVFAALDSERVHMTRIGHGPQPVAVYMLLMEHYLLRARDEWACSKKPPLDELDNLRKVGALVVACMEAHGAPPRVKSKANPIPGQPKKHAPR